MVIHTQDNEEKYVHPLPHLLHLIWRKILVNEGEYYKSKQEMDPCI